MTKAAEACLLLLAARYFFLVESKYSDWYGFFIKRSISSLKNNTYLQETTPHCHSMCFYPLPPMYG